MHATKAPALGRGFVRASLLQRAKPVVDVPADLVLGKAVALLKLAFELLAPTLDHIEIVVGELAPFLFGGALELLPIAFNPVPIQRILHCWVEMGFQRRGPSRVPGTCGIVNSRSAAP